MTRACLLTCTLILTLALLTACEGPWPELVALDAPLPPAPALTPTPGNPAPPPVACARQPASGFAATWTTQAGVAARLACAIDEEQVVQTSIQHFEHGAMLELHPDSRNGWGNYVLFDDGTFARFNDAYASGGNPTLHPLTPPPGYYAPRLSFNIVWVEAQGGKIGQRLGWGTDAERAGPGRRQRFTHGAMFWVQPTDQVLVFYESTVAAEPEAHWQLFDTSSSTP